MDNRHEDLARKLCEVMGWEYKTCPKWTALKKAAKGEAVVIGLDRLEEILKRLTHTTHTKGRP